MATPELPKPSLALPLGAASPLWFSFAAAATAGAAWFWWSRWREFTNLEAVMGGAAVGAAPRTPRAPPPADSPADIAFGSAVDDMPAIHNPELDPEVVLGLEEPPAPVAIADDLVRIVGIGPKLAAALAAEGVTTFAQMAEWTEAELLHFDKALDLKGRAVRDAWVAQAKRFVAGS
jgi:predicted flap endonuclease-1-like 5' DNA nuclease